MLIALLVVGVHARGLDRELDARRVRRVGVEQVPAREVVEAPVHVAHVHVLHLEHRRRVRGVDLVRRGRRDGGPDPHEGDEEGGPEGQGDREHAGGGRHGRCSFGFGPRTGGPGGPEGGNGSGAPAPARRDP